MGAEQNVECLLIPLENSYTPGKLLRGLTGPLPVTVLNYTTARMRAELTRTLADGNFDLVQMEGIHLSGYLPVIARAQSRPRLICDWHNIESELLERYVANHSHSLAKRWYGARTAHLTRTRERRLIEECDGVLVSGRTAGAARTGAGSPAPGHREWCRRGGCRPVERNSAPRKGYPLCRVDGLPREHRCRAVFRS
jgi:hypothetical protein